MSEGRREEEGQMKPQMKPQQQHEEGVQGGGATRVGEEHGGTRQV